MELPIPSGPQLLTLQINFDVALPAYMKKPGAFPESKN